MIRRSESRLHQAPGHESDNVPRRKRYRSMWGHQPTYLFYGIILAALLMLDGVELTDQQQDPPMPKAFAIRHPTKYNEHSGSSEGTTEAAVGTSHVTPRMNGTGGVRFGTDLEYKIIADEIQIKMNANMDPCNDFYEYACGRYVKMTKFPTGKSMVNTFSDDNDVLEKQLLHVVSEEIHPNETVSFRVAKSLYQLCMNTTRIEVDGTKPLNDQLDIITYWDYIEVSSWEKLMRINRRLGYSIDSIVDVSVGQDLKNASRMVIYVDQPTLGLSREYLVQGENNTNVRAYYNSMINAFVYLGANKTRVTPILLDVLHFEMRLASITLPKEKRRNATAMYNPMTLEKFQSKYPSTDWVEYFYTIMFPFIVIDKNETIIVRAPSFMDQLFPLLQETPNYTIANYITWRDTQFSSAFLPKKLRESVLGAQQKHESRTKECLDITMQRLPLAVEALYARTYAKYYTYLDVPDMVHDIKKAFVNILNKVDWMDDITRKAALEKMNSMAFKIGYRAQLMDENNEFYQGLELKPEASYLDTILYLDEFATTKKFKMLRQAVNYTFTHLAPAGVKVRYSLFENSIQFDPHYLQTPIFSLYRPEYMNYAIIGSFIGRAITHSFDDQGRQFDNIGKPADWCPTASGRALVEKAFCIRRQNVDLKFSVYDTAAEKIANIGGIKAAYYAYTANKSIPDTVIPGLTPEQMFWISAAQTWCSVYKAKVTGQCSTFGDPPDRLRVLESMGDMEEFSRDFGCHSKTRMNLTHQCKVW